MGDGCRCQRCTRDGRVDEVAANSGGVGIPLRDVVSLEARRRGSTEAVCCRGTEG